MRLGLALAVMAFLGSSTLAHADKIPVALSGTFIVGSFSGTLTYDTASGTFLDGSVQGIDYGMPFSFSSPASQYTACNGLWSCSNGFNSEVSLAADGYFLDLLVLGDLSGYGPGSKLELCTYIGNCIYDIGYNIYSRFSFDEQAYGDAVQDGTLTFGATFATPEPSSFALLGTGLLGIIAFVRRRFA